MKNYLYFSTGGGTDAAADSCMYPADSVIALEPITATQSKMTVFPRDNKAARTADLITLNHTVHFKVLCELIADRINAKGPFTVVKDLDNLVGINDISVVAITTAD